MLFISTMGMGLATIAAGVFAGIGLMGNFSCWVRLLIALFCIGSAVVAFFYQFRPKKSLRIDISGIGQIRLREYTKVDRVSDERQGITAISEEEYQMKDGSTLWSNLLFLQLVSSAGHMRSLRIFPDSVTSDEFRALYIACRWIAARKRSEAEQKIYIE